MKNTIVVKGKGIKSEFLCKEDIYPGMLAEIIVEDGIVKIKKNTNEGNLQETVFVTEYEAFGKTILDKAAAGDTAHVYFANAGDIIYTRVDSGVAVGDKLVSNGAGLLRLYVDGGVTFEVACSGDLDVTGNTSSVVSASEITSKVSVNGTAVECSGDLDVTEDTSVVVSASEITSKVSVNWTPADDRGLGITAIALDNAEEVKNGIYFARVIIL